MLKKVIISIVAVAALLFLFNSVLMPWYVKHTNTVQVPDIVGLNFLEAKAKIEEVGLEVKQGDVKYDESKPIGLVLDQNPPAGQMVKMDRRIYLTVCGGEQLIEVPKLFGKTLRDAKFTLEQRNLEIGEIVKKFSHELQEDYVLNQVIQPGMKVKKSTKVDLIVSNGPEIGSLRIPDLIGKKLEDAKKIISDNNLKIGKINYISSKDVAPGQILDQYPKKDKSATQSTVVDLFVSKKFVAQVEETETTEDANTTAPETKEPEKNTLQKDSDNNTGTEKKSKDTDTEKPSDKSTKPPLPMKKGEKNPPKDNGDKKTDDNNSGF